MTKNDVVTVKIEDMSTDGEGIGKADGFPLFVKDTVIGDVARVKVMKCRKNYGYARLEELVTASPDRVKPPCALWRACGGCQLQALSYEKQLAFKRKKVLGHLQRIGGLPAAYSETAAEGEIPVLPVIGCGHTLRYRNKALVPVGVDREGKTVAGFYAGRTHSIIPMEDCLLTPEENAAVIRCVLAWMGQCRIAPYQESLHTGVVRHILIRKGFTTGEMMVCVVVNADTLTTKAAACLVERLRAVNPAIASISYNINRERTNVIMGAKVVSLYGPGYILDRIGEITYAISPLSFYQVNPEQTKRLYEEAVRLAGLTGTETVWDLYCGIGTISLFLAKRAKHVFGVEIVPQAIKDAEENAKRNGIDNVTFFAGKSEEVFTKCYREDPERYRADVVVVDPPRKGCDVQLLETILLMQPQRLVYVSCDSATLARDLKWLTEHGNGAYKVECVVPVDQFGMTVHVETIVLIQKKNS